MNMPYLKTVEWGSASSITHPFLSSSYIMSFHSPASQARNGLGDESRMKGEAWRECLKVLEAPALAFLDTLPPTNMEVHRPL